jgi:hypothetical protein
MTQRKRVYILNHIQKCAGTSLSTYLFRSLRCRESAQLYMLSTIDDFYPKWKLGHYRDVESIYVGSHFAAEAHTLFPEHEPHYLTMLREPLARFLSSYKMSMDIGTLPDTLTPAEYFEGAWPNYLTLAIGDGSLREAKRRLAEEYRFVGIAEEFERSSQLLAHSLDLPAVGLLHANRSRAQVSERDGVSPELRSRFYRANSDDAELYRFAQSLFDERWRAAEAAIAAASRPVVAEESRLDVREFLSAYTHDVGRKDSFIFQPWSPGDGPLTIFWGVLYRTGFIPLCFRLLEQRRCEELRVVLGNLRRFHEHTPYAQPVLGRCIEFFERSNAAGETSRLSRRSLGDQLPVLSVDYVSFMDTDRMLRLGRAMRNEEDLKAKIENALRDE